MRVVVEVVLSKSGKTKHFRAVSSPRRRRGGGARERGTRSRRWRRSAADIAASTRDDESSHWSCWHYYSFCCSYYYEMRCESLFVRVSRGMTTRRKKDSLMNRRQTTSTPSSSRIPLLGLDKSISILHFILVSAKRPKHTTNTHTRARSLTRTTLYTYKYIINK